MDPSITIIVPVYNCEHFIKKCVDSVLGQSMQRFEAIFVDDGSTDRSGEYIREYAASDPRILYIHQHNAGPGAARNHGMEKAVGEYILFLDADDYLESNALERLYALAKLKEADILCYGFVQESEAGVLSAKRTYERYADFSKKDLIKMLVIGKLPYGAFQMFRSEVIKEHRCRYSISVRNNEELPFKLSAFLVSKRIIFTEFAPYHYVLHPKSLSQDLLEASGEFAEKVLQEISEQLKTAGFAQNEYSSLMHTYRYNKLIIWGYCKCRSHKLSHAEFAKFKSTLRTRFLEIDRKHVEYDLLPIKVKGMAVFVSMNLPLFFYIFVRIYSHIIEHRYKVESSDSIGV